MEEKTKSRLKIRMAEISVALVVVWLVIQISSFVQNTRRDMVSPSAWFEVREVFVPDHVEGSNPLIVYDRIIHEEFRGFWVVEVQRREVDGTTYMVCSGSGVNDYEPEDTIPDSRVAWDWFIGRACIVPPGGYRLRVSYDLTRIGWPVKQVVAISNNFRVLSAPTEEGELGR